MHTVTTPVSMTITFGIPSHVEPVAAPNAGALVYATAAGLTCAAHDKDTDAPKREPGRPPSPAKKLAQATAPSQKNGGAAPKKGAATPKIVFDVKGGVRKWLEDRLADGPASLDDLTKDLGHYAKVDGGASVPKEKVLSAARKSIRMYGVNPKVSNIVLNDGIMSLTSPSEG